MVTNARLALSVVAVPDHTDAVRRVVLPREDLPPLHGMEVMLPGCFRTARLVPQGTELMLEEFGGRALLRLPGFSCHQMIELQS